MLHPLNEEQLFLLNEFIEKKANLANKDINSYKSPDELYRILQETPLSDR